MNAFQLQTISVICVLSLIGCTNSDSETSDQAVFTKIEEVASCQDVITDSKIETFNQNQVEFQLIPSGFNRHCIRDTIQDGQPATVEVIGHSAVSLLPNFKFITISENSNSAFFLKMRIQNPTDEELQRILTKINLKGSSRDIFSFEQTSPAYIHFEKSWIYPISKVKNEEGGVVVFEIKIPPDQASSFRQNLAPVTSGKASVDILWLPVSGIISQQSIGSQVQSVSWSRSDAVSILEVLRFDMSDVMDLTLFEYITDLANEWKVNSSILHQRLPEILNFAIAQWDNPVITEVNAKRLLFFLNYISQQDPSHSRYSVFVAYEQISRFQESVKSGLQTAWDYTQKAMWTSEQFHFLVELAQRLNPALTTRSWIWAVGLAERAQYDTEISQFAGKVAMSLSVRKMAPELESIDLIFTKIQAGLNEANVDLYFKTYDFLKTNVRSTALQAEGACDELVLSGRLNSENQKLFLNLFNWLEDNMFFSFSESLDLIRDITVTYPLDGARADLFKKAYFWLAVTVPLSKAEATMRIQVYLNSLNMTEPLFISLKKEYETLLQQGVSPREALYLAEDKVLLPR